MEGEDVKKKRKKRRWNRPHEQRWKIRRLNRSETSSLKLNNACNMYIYIRGKGVEEEEPWKSIAPLYKRANGFASRRNVYGGGH